MINPAWPEIAKATPANLHHQVGHDPALALHVKAIRRPRLELGTSINLQS
jgi:hypothetical protein